MKIYLAGPVRGTENLTNDRFKTVADRLRSEGHLVFDPVAYQNVTKESDSRRLMSVCLNWIIKEADKVYALQGWNKSDGASCEVFLAESIGLEVEYE